MTDSVWAALLVALGGIFVKAVERLLPDRAKHLDDATSIRKELREENTQLRKEMREAKTESDSKIVRLELEMDQRDTTIAELRGRVVQLEEQVSFWKQRVQALQLTSDGAERRSKPRE